MPNPTAKLKRPANVASRKLARHLTAAVKRHLLANGAEPAYVNEEVLYAALQTFDHESRETTKKDAKKWTA